MNEHRMRILKMKGKNSVAQMVIYYILIGIGFVYLYPLLYMIATSFMTSSDLISTDITWLPSSFYLGNFKSVLQVLDVKNTFMNTIMVATIATLLQTISGALAGYAFARYEFPLKKLWMLMLIVTFLIPVPVTIVPKYVLFAEYGLKESILSVLLPALFGQGLKGSIIVLVFYQFFRSYPKALDEAAMIDGASRMKIFIQIVIPLAVPALIVAVLFSFVWNWNETYQYSILVGDAAKTMPLKLSSFGVEYAKRFPVKEGSLANRVNEALTMAATLITMSPLFIIYLCLQKYFVEAIETTGITGE